jgi:O-antigen ligase
MQTGGSLGYQLQWASVFLISGFVIWRNSALAWSNFRAINPFIIAMLIYCAMGMLWSPAFIVTLKRTIQFAGLIAFSLAVLSERRPWTHFVYVIAMALTSIELASAFVAIFNPSFGIDAYFGYAWRGVVSGKNTLGGIGALATLVWMALGHAKGIRRPLYWAGLLLSLLTVVMSKSSTSLTITVLGLLSFWLLQRQHIGSPLWLQRILIVVALILLVLLHLFFIQESRLPDRSEILQPFADLFGKSADLTGRADVWAPLYIEIEKHWLFGVGYGAFWLGPGSASQPILDTLPWIPFQGHNGYLDVLNELGAVGASLFLFVVLFHVQCLFRLMKSDRNAAALFSALLVIFLFSNLTESTAFRGVVFEFILFLFSCISVNSILNQPSNGAENQ